MKAREILLLIFILLVGTLAYVIHTGGISIDGDWEVGVIGVGRSWSYEESMIVEAPVPGLVEVINSHGAVDIQGVDRADISLRLRKKIWRRTEKKALEIAGKLKPEIDRKGDRIVFSVNRDEFKKRNFETSFVLEVPRQTAVEIENSYGKVTAANLVSAKIGNRHGRVKASNIDGRLSVDGSYENIDIVRVGGECAVVGRHADVSVVDVAGRVTIDHSYGRVTAEDAAAGADIIGRHSAVVCRNIKGPVDVRTSYERVALSDVGPAVVRGHHAPVAAERIDGDLKVSTSYEKVRALDVRGDLDVEGKSVGVYGRGIAGREIRIATSYEDLDLGDFSGRASISLSHADATLAPSSPDYPMEIRNTYSTIRFFWPAGDRGPFEARSRGGEIKWGLAAVPSLNTTNGEAVVKAFEDRSGRPAVMISTTHGDIFVAETSPQK